MKSTTFFIAMLFTTFLLTGLAFAYSVRIYVNTQPSDTGQQLVKTCDCGTNSTCECLFTYDANQTTYAKAETWNDTTFLSSSDWILIYMPPTPVQGFNMSFWAVNFAADVKNAISGSVGDVINLPVSIQNLGLLADNYTVNATPIILAGNIALDNSITTTNVLKTNEFANIVFRIAILSKSSTNPQIGVWVYSNTDIYSCSSAADCNMIQSFERNTTCEVVSHKCAIYRIVDVSTGLKSMPEIGFFEIMQILVFASLIALITFK